MFELVPAEPMIDAEWLAMALGRPGEIASFTRRSIGTGQVGENVRYDITWATGSTEPSTVVGKFPSLDEISLATAEATSSYVKEIGFYRDLQSTVSIRTPKIMHLGEALEENRFVLIMEDISPAEQGDQIEATTVERGRLAVDALPGLHAPHWGADLASQCPWLPVRDEQWADDHHNLYQILFPGFAERYAGRLSAEVIEFGEWLGTKARDLGNAFQTPQTLIHGDYRLDNMLYATGPGAPLLTVVDWQTTSVGYGPADLAYFIGAGFLPDQRREVENEFVESYIDGLASAGAVTNDAERDAVRHDYVIGSFTGYFMAVVASQIVGRTDRGDEMFCVMAERHACQADDLGLRDRDW